MIAWKQFVTVIGKTAPAGDALFETWASNADTFNANPHWPDGAFNKTLINRLGRSTAKGGSPITWAVPPLAKCEPGRVLLCIGKETFRNRATFDFIVANKLTTQKGLATAFGAGFDFPVDAIEVKAEWLPVAELAAWSGVAPNEAASLYHVSVAPINGEMVPIALVALHVITKEIPNWTWATFEHWRNPGRCDEIGCIDRYGAMQSKVAANGEPVHGYPECFHTKALKRMFADAGIADLWLNYCLKGSQTGFVTAAGTATLLSNSISETLNAGIPPARSSCMTCHAEAAFDDQGRAAKIRYEIGAPKPFWFVGAGSRSAPQYKQANFIWSVPLCALSADGISPCVPPPK
jgi:hypothetical protein